MQYSEFKDNVFRHAAAADLDAFELFSDQRRSLQVAVTKGEVDRYQDATGGGAGLKVLKSGRAGFAFTEVYDEESAARLVVEAVSNLSVVDAESEDTIYRSRDDYMDVAAYDGSFEEVTGDTMIDWALSLEKSTLKRDKRISMVPTAAVASFSTVTRMANSAGLDLSFRSGGGYAYAVALATKDGDRKTGMDFATAVRPDALALDRIPPTAADKALTMLGASPVKSGKYRVIVKPEQVASFLQFLLEMVSADVVQKGMSALAGRVGSRIAGEAVTLIDEPVVNESLFNLPFDSQGVATRRKEIVADGVLTTFLHSLKTAAKDDVAPTGNGFRAGYRGAETIHPVNLVLAAGEYSYEQLLGRLGDGLVINWLSGLHAGTEAASGEFSLSATGLLVEGGTVVRPVDQITISGNLLDLLGGVEAVGSDLTQAPVFSFGLYTPSILVGEVDIAGE